MERITSLPDNLHIKGRLELCYCKNIKILPDNLRVEGNLDIFGCNIIEFPKNLYVGNTIILCHTKEYFNELLLKYYFIISEKIPKVRSFPMSLVRSQWCCRFFVS